MEIKTRLSGQDGGVGKGCATTKLQNNTLEDEMNKTPITKDIKKKPCRDCIETQDRLFPYSRIVVKIHEGYLGS